MKKIIALALLLTFSLSFMSCSTPKEKSPETVFGKDVLVKEAKIESIYMESIPNGYENSYEGDAAQMIGDYLASLRLTPYLQENDYLGMCWDIEIEYEDGTVSNVYHSANVLIKVDGGEWYKMESDEAHRLDTLLTELNSMLRSYEFEAEYIRVFEYSDNDNSSNRTVIKTKSELDAYYEANKENYDFRRFLEVREKYTDEFFETKDLVLINVTESSGSHRHEITDVRCVDIGAWEIDVERSNFGYGATDDMGYWLLIVEISEKPIKKDDTVRINLSELIIKFDED